MSIHGQKTLPSLYWQAKKAVQYKKIWHSIKMEWGWISKEKVESHKEKRYNK